MHRDLGLSPDITFGPWQPSATAQGKYWNSASATMSTRPVFIKVGSGEGTGTYVVCDGLATSKCKEIADAMQIAYKDSWFAHRIAQEILKKAKGSLYNTPTRGACETILNMAIFDDFLLLHQYENDGWGNADSIRRTCFVFKKS